MKIAQNYENYFIKLKVFMDVFAVKKYAKAMEK
jgi:hypothetical protein